MPKRALKRKTRATQGDACALSGAPLQEDPSLYDTHRPTPKASNGTYTPENTALVDPRAHMAEHGTLRDRETSLAEIKSVFDDRVQTTKLRLKINNQLLAYQRRTDDRHPQTEAFLIEMLEQVNARAASIDKYLALLVKSHDDPVSKAALGVPGMGPVTVAALTVYIDLEKANYPSSLWAYVGLDRPAQDRYEKGVTGGGNKTLRTVLWNTVNSMMKKVDNPYRRVYDAVKERLAASEKKVMSRNTQGKLVEVAWKDAKPSHRHGAALRSMMKHVLADYWRVGRQLRGLEVKPLYAEAKLGHETIVPTIERGWPI